ncbi:MAG: sugar ABC transporter permease, partial [Anaerolineae bacterium]|nr:sugar ABC transporter permease [Anaerolineae bacterium]
MTQSRDRLVAILALLPSILLIAIFVYGFIAWTGYTAMTDSNALQQLSGQPSNFIGLQNFTELFTGVLNQRFRVDVVNTVFFTLLFIAACLGLGMGLAVLLDQHVAGEGIFRTIFLFPMALSFVVTGVVWKWLFNPASGINRLPTFIGQPAGTFRWFISEDRWLQFNWQNIGQIIAIIVLDVIIIMALIYWSRSRRQAASFAVAIALLLMNWILLEGPQQITALDRPEMHGFNVALFAVVLAAAWQMSGYTMAMYLAGLRGIPEELREAARVDGAGEWGVYRYIVFPMLRPITLSAMIILGHQSLKIFDLV